MHATHLGHSATGTVYASVVTAAATVCTQMPANSRVTRHIDVRVLNEAGQSLHEVFDPRMRTGIADAVHKAIQWDYTGPHVGELRDATVPSQAGDTRTLVIQLQHARLEAGLREQFTAELKRESRLGTVFGSTLETRYGHRELWRACCARTVLVSPHPPPTNSQCLPELLSRQSLDHQPSVAWTQGVGSTRSSQCALGLQTGPEG